MHEIGLIASEISCRRPSKEGCRSQRQDRALQSAGVETKGAAYRRSMDVDQMEIESVVPLVGRIPVETRKELVRRSRALRSERAEYPRCRAVHFDLLRDDHIGRL